MAGEVDLGIPKLKRNLRGDILESDEEHPLVHPFLKGVIEEMAAEADGVVGSLPLGGPKPPRRPTHVIITTEREGRFPRHGRRVV